MKIATCPLCMKTRDFKRDEFPANGLVVSYHEYKGYPVASMCECGVTLRWLRPVCHTEKEIRDSKAKQQREIKSLDRSYAAMGGWNERRLDDHRSYGDRIADGFATSNGGE